MIIGRPRQTLIVCAYRSLSVPTALSIMGLLREPTWRFMSKTGDALISRARSSIVSAWLRDTEDDAFLMVDDDLTFSQEDAERVISLVRSGKDIVAGVTPFRSGRAVSVVPDGRHALGEREVVQVRYAGGFLAFHRRVFERLRAELPLCHERETSPFWPFFQPMVVEMGDQQVYLSEDWACLERAHNAGFRLWLDQRTRIGHQASVEVTSDNNGRGRPGMARAVWGPVHRPAPRDRAGDPRGCAGHRGRAVRRARGRCRGLTRGGPAAAQWAAG